METAEGCGLAAGVVIWANFVGTIGVDLVGIGLAAFGVLNPLMAAFIHVSSELAFILNSAKLLPTGVTPQNETGLLVPVHVHAESRG